MPREHSGVRTIAIPSASSDVRSPRTNLRSFSFAWSLTSASQSNVGMRSGGPFLAVGTPACFLAAIHRRAASLPAFDIALRSLGERERRQVWRRGDDDRVDLGELGADVLGLRPVVRPIALVELFLMAIGCPDAMMDCGHLPSAVQLRRAGLRSVSQ